jgi:isopenicillin-N N-acyltransferase-like protein
MPSAGGDDVMIARGQAIVLDGEARERGRGQAAIAPERREAVHRAILSRIAPHRDLLAAPERRMLLGEMVSLAERHTPMAFAEAQGVAEGWEITFDDLMAFLHLPIFLDMEEARDVIVDGCSSFVAQDAESRPFMAKNRDYRGEHAALQTITLHRDPAIAGGAMLSIGSLGAVSAFSSGLNAAGFALTDTQVPTADHGAGVCRYLLMSELLATCGSVENGLALIAQMPHAGGGTLILGDADGAGAAIELGHRRQNIERLASGSYLARTNHHLSEGLAGATLVRAGEPMGGSSKGRLSRLTQEFADAQRIGDPMAFARRVVASHDEDGGASGMISGLCRHGQDGDSETISAVAIAPWKKALYFCAGRPCTEEWREYLV